jgi:cytochrome oxidase Cu insertion factor (SCO1/SenC/PrrC family)
VVILNFFFASCVNVCLTQGVTLKRLKSHLAERFGKEIFFVSISKNPKADTPAKLKRWGKQFGVGPGWSLVTGNLKVIDELSLSLTSEEAASAAHSPILIIGNDRTGVWSLAYGEASTSELTEIIETVSSSVIPSQR